MEKVIVAPVQNSPLLNPQPTPVPFVRTRLVRILLLHIQRQPEKLAPCVPRPLHQLLAHPVVHHLKKPPLPAGARDRTQRRFAQALLLVQQVLEVNDRDVDFHVSLVAVCGKKRGSFGGGFDVEVRDCGYAAFCQGLDSNDRLRPRRLQAIHCCCFFPLLKFIIIC